MTTTSTAFHPSTRPSIRLQPASSTLIQHHHQGIRPRAATAPLIDGKGSVCYCPSKTVWFWRPQFRCGFVRCRFHVDSQFCFRGGGFWSVVLYILTCHCYCCCCFTLSFPWPPFRMDAGPILNSDHTCVGEKQRSTRKQNVCDSESQKCNLIAVDTFLIAKVGRFQYKTLKITFTINNRV